MARVTIVGGGIAAAALARQLAGDEVTVLEQHARPFGEATGQSSGMIRRLGDDPVERALAVRSAAAMAARGEYAVTGGVVALRDDATAANDAAAHLRARGIPVDDPGPVGVLAGAPVRARLRVAVDGVTDPVALAAGWLRGSGAAVRTGVRVLGLRSTGGRVDGVETDHGPLPADAVVLAGGAWAAGLGPSTPLVALRRAVFRVEAAPDPRGAPWVWIDDRGLWARPEAETWLLSACEEVPDPPGPGAKTTTAPAPADLERLRAKVDELLPALSGFRVREGWTGLRTFAPDRRPTLGPDPAHPGVHWLAGLGGFGITCAWACAEVVAAGLRDREIPWLRTAQVAPDRSSLARFPIRPTGEASRAVLHAV